VLLLGAFDNFQGDFNMENPFLIVFFINLLPYIPLYLVWIIGMVLSSIHRKRHSKVSLLAFISLFTLFVLSLVVVFSETWLPINASIEGLDAKEMGMTLYRIKVIAKFMSAVAWGMLIAAIFGWRTQLPTSTT